MRPEIEENLKNYTPETIEMMRDKGPEIFLILVELWKDSAKGGINRNLIFEKAKRILIEIQFPLP